MNDSYCYLHLRGPGRDTQALKSALEGAVLDDWRASRITLWGVWEGLFGVASNELIIVGAAADGQQLEDFTGALGEARAAALEVVDALLMTPTVRPTSRAPCERPGLYVFRFFRVNDSDVDEVVTLSRQAWETFESADDYAAEPQGLFRPHPSSGAENRMLLVTWYDGLNSWQTSRRPAPEATANFQRRRELTHGTLALATRLVDALGV